MLKSPIYERFISKYFFITFFAGLIPRVLVFFLIPLDWNWDSYHHWQISYFTLKIGLSQGRMWDLNGCEYYWGVIPHLVHASLLWVFSSPSIIFYRVFNIVLGGFNTYLVYLIGRNYRGEDAGLLASFLFGLFPTPAIFDTIAMQETLALFFALLSLFLVEKHPVASGVFLALASQSRIEYWLISMIIIVGMGLAERSRKVFDLAVSWLLVTALFCWFFYSRTSNPVYPLY